jgi:hypothetical protein
MELVMEPQCEKIERQLSNDGSSSSGHVSAAASIYHQDESGTALVMPCDGIALDEIGNEYQVDGAYKLSCSPPVSFDYVTSIKTWRADHCCTYPDWKYEKRNYGYSSTEGSWSCFMCDNCCKSSVTCETTPIKLEFCECIENFNRSLHINGEVIDESWATNMTLEDSPVSSAPYGFWRNETSIFL